VSVEEAMAIIDRLIFAKTEKHLSNLQIDLLHRVWQGEKYSTIAECLGYTEGHIKDIASVLWQQLSEVCTEKVTKNNLRGVLARWEGAKIQDNPSMTNINYNFIGRQQSLDKLQILTQQNAKIIVLQGEGGVGKTTLAQQYFQRQNFEISLDLLMAKESQNLVSVESIVEEWLQKDLGEEAGKEFGVTLCRLKRQLEKREIGTIIDNFETILDKDGKIVTAYRSYLELLRVLTDWRVKSLTIITSRDRLCEADLNLVHYRLTGLDLSGWQEYFQHRQINFSPFCLSELHRLYGGNAKAMGILCGTIQTDFEGNLDIYWQENQDNPLIEIDLNNLVASQFDRLQKLDRDAYNLLCRLGCYRYQEIATIAKEAVFALIDERSDLKPSYLLESLKNRSLIEHSQGKYWLHPTIRSEAIFRLRQSHEDIIVNRQAAEYWTNSIASIRVLTDAIIAWEAFYHYVAIEDYEAASRVILKSRRDRWGRFLPLGTSLYRMGLLQLVLTGITQIIDKIEDDRNYSELHNILGDLYWTSGKIRSAIETQQKTLDTVSQSFDRLTVGVENKLDLYYLKMLQVDSLLSLGLYHLDLWELPTAGEYFSRVIVTAENTSHHSWAEKATVCLALVNSYLGLQDKAIELAESIYLKINLDTSDRYKGRFAYFLQLLGRTFFNLGYLERTGILLKRAIEFARESNYLQIEAKTLIDLAIFSRQQEDLSSARSQHLEAVEICQKIGAKCDLAEAYWQLGLTLIALQEINSAEQNFQLAIDLFQEIEAPKQIEKVIASSWGYFKIDR
jgi:tetratricopeptide (TPR) repeat protein